MDDLIVEFVTESNESLAEIDADLLSLEQDPNNKSLLGNIFRLMHTIKGTCGFLGLPRLESVAHAAENVFGRFRDGDLEVKPEYVTLIFEAIDRVRSLLDHISANGVEPDGDDNELKAKLNAVYEGKDSQQIANAETKPALSLADIPPDKELTLEELESIDFGFPQPPTDEEIAAKEAAETETETPPAPAEPEAEEIKAPLANAAESHDGGDGAAAAGNDKTAAAQSLRVSVDVLENLMTMVSELVLTRNQLMQILRAQKESEFTTPLQRLNHVVSDLQDGVMKTRMQPIGNAWAKLPRIIRDLSIELKKKIDLEMVGQDTELDRQVLDLIKDPLTHMVRNSGDHGIEIPEERKAAGKPETGKITLKAYHEGGHIIIEINDDGKGLNTARIKQKMLEKNIVTQEELAAMTDKQIHMHIFHAGFSTAEKVTSVSGRGVGMDVVRTNIEKIGGTIELDSKEGKGSKFTIKIPLTLAIVSALIVAAGKERYAIPQLSVQELVMISDHSDEKIETIEGTPFFRLRDRLLPLVTLTDMLKFKSIHVDRDKLEKNKEGHDDNVVSFSDYNEAQAADSAKGRHRYIVVTKVGTYSFGIIVDKVFDTEEIVVKPVAQILKHIEIFSGNTILGDGSVIMILDPTGIARASGEIDKGENSGDLMREQEEAARRASEQKKTALLLFSGMNKAPCAVPLSLVARLEEFNTSDIEFSGDKMLIQYRGELMPLIKFDERIDLTNRTKFVTLVFAEEATESSMGLVVNEILDIVEDHIDIKVSSDRPALLGSCIIAGKATEVIDVGHWLLQGQHKWFGDHKGEAFIAEGAKSDNGDSNKRKVLLVDDSPFFRNMLTPLLSVAGYEVTTVEGPTEALRLREKGMHFDVIVSDIEMPDMDGFTFAENVRSNPDWTDTPIIALSSHDTPKDIQHGIEKGFSKHVGKYDRDTLLNTLSEALSESGQRAGGESE